MKLNSVILFLLSLFTMHFAFSAGPLPPVNRPAQPVNNCAAVVPPLTGMALTQCNNQHALNLNAWQENEDLVNNLEQNALSTDGTGQLVTAPGSSTNATAAINGVKTQMANDPSLQNDHSNLQYQNSIQGQEAAVIEYLTDNTVTGSLQEVQILSTRASGHYTSSQTILLSYYNHNKNLGDTANGVCPSPDYAACKQAAADYAAAAAYFSMSENASNQVQAFAQRSTKACQNQNDLSIIKNVCDPMAPGSPVFIPGMSTPPNYTWFDPFTGLCTPSAPQLCSQIFSSGSGSFPTKVAANRSCPGGGTGCLTQMIVTTTPMGVKYSFKNKSGKEYSFYAKDLKDEKSLVKAGLTPEQAKKMLFDVNLTAKKIDQTSAAIAGQLPALKSQQLPDQKNANKKAGAMPAVSKPVQLPDQPLINRQPSTEGLSKNLNGDLIGVRSDDIFKMINRRYQHKEQQVLFYGPYQ